MKKMTPTDSQQARRFWQHHLEQCRGSGLSQAEYCRRHNLSIKSFGYRKRTLGARALSLVEVPLAAPVSPRPLRLQVGSDYTILIEPGFDAGTLQRLLGVLGR